MNAVDFANKKCTRCSVVKPISDFYKIKKSKDGFDLYCKDCRRKLARKYRDEHLEQERERVNKWHEQHREQSRENAKRSYWRDPQKSKEQNRAWRENNKEKLLEYGRKYRENNKEKIINQSKEWREKNTDKIATYRKRYADNNLDKLRKKSALYRKNNPEKCKERIKNWQQKNRKHIQNKLNERYKNEPKRRLSIAFSANMRQSLKGNKKGRSWESLVGYSVTDLMQHLQSKFKDGMSWNNYGEWHIDHIRPIDSFNYTTPDDDEFKECWSLSNLQPLWAEENIRKSNKLS